jgi:hypothetical protein
LFYNRVQGGYDNNRILYLWWEEKWKYRGGGIRLSGKQKIIGILMELILWLEFKLNVGRASGCFPEPPVKSSQENTRLRPKNHPPKNHSPSPIEGTPFFPNHPPLAHPLHPPKPPFSSPHNLNSQPPHLTSVTKMISPSLYLLNKPQTASKMIIIQSL